MSPAAKNMIIRVQSGDFGTKRIEVTPLESVEDLYEKTRIAFNLDSTKRWMLYTGRDKSGALAKSASRTVTAAKLKHGDMIFMIFDSGCAPTSTTEMDVSAPDAANNNSTDISKSVSQISTTIVEDDVDIALSKMDGKVERGLSSQCTHNARSKCFNCVALEPWDENLLRSKDIKFLSFHSFVRKQQSGVDKGKFLFLEDIDCKIKSGCRDHLPWPKGICTKCQPSAIVLNRQKYRHVDGIVFENHFFIDHFLNYWRQSGCQRIGIMYGYYEPHPDIPLGIRAHVVAIYEPPQNSTPHSVEILEDPHEKQVISIAKKLGLQPVGWIFTDLLPKDTRLGTVECLRGSETFFLSAEECIMAAEFQNKFPNPCKLAPSGFFGSKFVTVIATGDQSNQIHFEAYQVSNQCMALVRDDCLVPTVDRPELGYVRESTNEQYVPDVFYMKVDQYGNQVRELARPLPVEYLLLDLSATFPLEMRYTFAANDHISTRFHIENREMIGEGQSLSRMRAYLRQFPNDNLTQALNDFHAILYLAQSDVLPIKSVIDELCQVVRTNDPYKSRRFFDSEEWKTVTEILDSDIDMEPAANIGGVSSAPSWHCAVCTYENKGSVGDCEMCGLPKNSGEMMQQ